MVIESGIPSSLMSAGQGRGDILRVCVYIYMLLFRDDHHAS